MAAPALPIDVAASTKRRPLRWPRPPTRCLHPAGGRAYNAAWGARQPWCPSSVAASFAQESTWSLPIALGWPRGMADAKHLQEPARSAVSPTSPSRVGESVRCLYVQSQHHSHQLTMSAAVHSLHSLQFSNRAVTTSLTNWIAAATLSADSVPSVAPPAERPPKDSPQCTARHSTIFRAAARAPEHRTGASESLIFAQFLPFC